MALVLDTGPLLASLDVDDGNHATCSALIANTRERRVIPAAVLPELDYWCHARLGVDAFLSVLADIDDGSYVVEDLHAADYRRVSELCDRYRDLGLGFVDAAVIATVERLGERKVATLDHRHFAAVRPNHAVSLELLPAA